MPLKSILLWLLYPYTTLVQMLFILPIIFGLYINGKEECIQVIIYILKKPLWICMDIHRYGYCMTTLYEIRKGTRCKLICIYREHILDVQTPWTGLLLLSERAGGKEKSGRHPSPIPLPQPDTRKTLIAPREQTGNGVIIPLRYNFFIYLFCSLRSGLHQCDFTCDLSRIESHDKGSHIVFNAVHSHQCISARSDFGTLHHQSLSQQKYTNECPYQSHKHRDKRGGIGRQLPKYICE